MKIKISIALLLVLLTIGMASAADGNATHNDQNLQTEPEIIQNDGNFSELSTLIENTPANATLELDRNYVNIESETYGPFSNGISISKPMTIDGKGHTIDGNSHHIFNIDAANITLKNLIFKNAAATFGGVIDSTSDNITIINCRFMDFSALDCCGGAIHAWGNNWNIINSTFTNSNPIIPYDYGLMYNGAIDAQGNNWNIINSTFINCSDYCGGAINAEGNNWKIENSKFMKCLGTIGGAMNVRGSNWNIIKSAFTQCAATDRTYGLTYGGAIYTHHEGTDVIACNNWNIIDSTFTKCTSNDGGGAIYSNGANWKIINSKFSECKANSFRGGAIMSTETNCNVINSTFTKCHANKEGGAIYFKGKSPKLLNSVFKDNTGYKYPNWYSVYDAITTVVASNMQVIYSANSDYTIKVYDTNGKPVNGEKVIIKLNGKAFQTLTTKNGIAKFKVTQTPGTYKLTITALKNTATKTLTVKHLVTLNNIKVKKSSKKVTIQASLAKVNGKYLKNKQITFKFNGKTYKAKTNSKGIAKVTISKSVLKKLKVGKTVNYQATYMKDTVKKSVKVQK